MTSEEQNNKPSTSTVKKNHKGTGGKLIGFLIVFFVVAVGYAGAYYFYTQYQKVRNNPAIVGEEELQKVVAIVGRLIELPSDETPTLATVLDREKLQDQVFFAKAENGDKLLVYTTWQKAILYRPSTNKIVDVAPVYFDTKANNQNR